MPFFRDCDEVWTYIGGALRAAAEHPESGPMLAAGGVVVSLEFSEPDCAITVRMTEPVAIERGAAPDADVRLKWPADAADRFWRGEYNISVGIARGRVIAEGPVERALACVPALRPVFPLYWEMVAEKDRATARAGVDVGGS